MACSFIVLEVGHIRFHEESSELVCTYLNNCQLLAHQLKQHRNLTLYLVPILVQLVQSYFQSSKLQLFHISLKIHFQCDVTTQLHDMAA